MRWRLKLNKVKIDKACVRLCARYCRRTPTSESACILCLNWTIVWRMHVFWNECTAKCHLSPAQWKCRVCPFRWWPATRCTGNRYYRRKFVWQMLALIHNVDSELTEKSVSTNRTDYMQKMPSKPKWIPCEYATIKCHRIGGVNGRGHGVQTLAKPLSINISMKCFHLI